MHRKRIVAVAIATACLCAPSALARPATDAASPPSAAVAKAKKKSHLDKRERARIRRELRRQVRRKPTSVFGRDFLKRASLVDFKLPLTIRLNPAPDANGPSASDDQIQITWDDSVVPWPLAGGVIGPVQTSNLDGQFTVESSFSDSEGYGELGAMETILGGKIQMTATPFVISSFAAPCPDNPQLEVAPNTQVAVTSAGAKYGLMNLFSGDFRGSLSLRMTFSGQSYSGCAVAPTPTDTVDNSTAIPMPLRFQGNVRVSPAVTADGKVRLGVLTVDDSVTPQTSTFAYVRACSGSAPCSPLQFPARIKLIRLRAEVILGDAF
ncbi:MAG TPA: hypothetical protein VFN64_13720 [Burkholderiaceae bacterium]|nr:hypothetical protein [Burkholderiaceae bacterium]